MEDKMQQRTIPRSGDGLWLYFGLTYALSWMVWLAAIASGTTTSSPLGALLFVLGGAAPSIVGVILLYRFAPAAERRDFWARLVRFRDIQPAWYALILLGFPAIALLGLAINAWLGGAQPGYKGLLQVAAQPLLLIPL